MTIYIKTRFDMEIFIEHLRKESPISALFVGFLVTSFIVVFYYV